MFWILSSSLFGDLALKAGKDIGEFSVVSVSQETKHKNSWKFWIKIGACAMTTKFLDNKICNFKFLLSWRFPRKTAFGDNFPLGPHAQPPSKTQILFLLSSRRL